MNIAKKAGMGVLRGLLAVVQTPGRINYGYHSIRSQLRDVPLGINLTRAKQVITGKSPMIKPLWQAEEAVMVRLCMDDGVIEVNKLAHRNAREAFEKQGIERIVVTDFNDLLFGLQRARIILKQGAAGMADGETRIFCFNRWDPRPDFMSIARRGAELQVVSRPDQA